jgi:cytoskeletal protein CcmA (bactofilin family)
VADFQHMKPSQDVLTIDPVAMNVVNRVCAGSRLSGAHVFKGGLLVQGEISGELETRGRLIIWAGGQVSGRIKIWGDLYLFGQLGLPGTAENETVVECLGTAYIASTGISSGTLLAHRIRMYDGAQLQGPFKTLKEDTSLPELNELVDTFSK